MAVTPFDEDLDVQDAGARETRAAELDHEFDRLDEADRLDRWYQEADDY